MGGNHYVHSYGNLEHVQFYSNKWVLGLCKIVSDVAVAGVRMLMSVALFVHPDTLFQLKWNVQITVTFL